MPKKEFFYEHITNDISGKIECGEYKFMQYLPSERDMADHYQVNRTTIRKALDVLAEKNYIEKRRGASSRVIFHSPENSGETEKKEKVIGFFIPGGIIKDIHLHHPFYMCLYYYLESMCREENYRVICITVTDLEDFISLTRQYHFSGVFFTAKIRREIVQYAKSEGMIAVAVNEKFPDIPCVITDNVNIGYLAVKYLLEKGHRKIAVITGPDTYFTSEDRMLGVAKAMNEYHSVLDPQNVVRTDWTYHGGYTAMKKLLSRSKDTWPTAVFTFNEEMTHGAVKALAEQNLNVPEDMSIIGYDNASRGKYGNVLTMIDGNIKKVAKTASTILMNRIAGYDLDYEVVIQLPVKLLEYESVRDIH